MEQMPKYNMDSKGEGSKEPKAKPLQVPEPGSFKTWKGPPGLDPDAIAKGIEEQKRKEKSDKALKRFLDDYDRQRKAAEHQRDRDPWTWITVYLPWADNIVDALFVSLLVGGVIVGSVRTTLWALSDLLKPNWRLVTGALMFLAAGMLDMVVWWYKPD